RAGADHVAALYLEPDQVAVDAGNQCDLDHPSFDLDRLHCDVVPDRKTAEVTSEPITKGRLTVKKTMLAAVSIVIMAAFAGPALADGELHIFNWGDYTNPDLVKKFEETYKVKITLDDYDLT